MSWTGNDFSLRFARRPRSALNRLIAVGMILAVFTLAWFFVSSQGLYWLLLALIAALAWAASYGWRQALAILIRLLNRIEHI